MLRLCESPSKPLSTKSNKVLAGLFAECEVFNQNERRYPKSIYMPALDELMPKIREGRLLGECDHPTDRDEVCLTNVSHVIRECRVEGNKIYGSVELLDTPSGKIAQALVEAGIPLGISSRGVGNTKRVDEGDEVTDFKLITFDLVADPSFSNAILSESAKVRLNTRLDAISSTLPLNESTGSNDIRKYINDIKDSVEKVPTVSSALIESVGSLTESNLLLEDKYSEIFTRYKSVNENMRQLQDTYNTLYQTTKVLESKYKKSDIDHKKEVESLKESHSEEISRLNEELVLTRKQLAIEKRGLSIDSMLPILEGLTEMSDIEKKLDSIKHLGTRRYVETSKVSSLTEGNVPKKVNKLSSIISSV